MDRNNPILIDKDKELRELEWAMIEEIMSSAKRKFIEGNHSMSKILEATVELMNITRKKIDKTEREYDPSEKIIKDDLKERRAADEETLKNMF
jgi:hypothetical protein